ncbi:MAG: 50S ribosomal protein L24 [Bacteroidota bacterium]
MSKKNKNKTQQKRFAPKLKIKKGDQVRIIAGEYKNEEGEVLEVFPKKNRAIVEDVNIVKKHKKPTQEAEGGIFEEPASIHISNLMLLDPSTGEPTRVGRRMEDGKLKRYSKKSDKVID